MELLQDIIIELEKLGYGATIEYPGCIAIECLEPATMWFGTANEFWCGDLISESGDILNSRQTEVPSTSKDAAAIASAIVEAFTMVTR